MRLRLSPEESLLVAAVGGPAADPAAMPDWHRLLELASWHRVLPLLHQHLAAVAEAGGTVPAPVLEELQRLARESMARGLYLRTELGRVLAALAAEDVPVVLLKGAALVETVYPHVGLRPMGDLDLLVPREDVERAHEAVRALGYEVKGAKVQERDDDAWLATIHHHLPLVLPATGAVVELHHRILVDRHGWDVDGVWARARPLDASPPRLVPAPEDLFLHVAAHFALDRINRGRHALGQLADVVRLAQGGLDWDAVVARARQDQVADRVFLAVLAADLLVGGVAPPATLDALRPASYTPALGAAFVRDRVLRAAPALPLEQLAGGRRRLFGAHTLEVYVRPDEVEPPSRMRLRARRLASIAGRAARLAARPRALVDDVRLSRWTLRLRR